MLGDLAIKAAAALAVVAFVAAVRWARGREASERTFRLAYHGMTALLAVACALLMRAILVHDFRFEYVVGYSSRDLPLLYLVSAFWAGQEGTFLLWALIAALVGYPLFRKRAFEPATVAACYVPTIGFLFLLMLDRSGNPFRLADAIPPDGRGLNILLQDPWMASHPPVVFLGYAAMTVPAVLALATLLRRGDREWLGPALRWSIVAFVSLGAGIILGGFWAYKVLGWGGYWGWDPVENASLVPWLVVAALLHGLLAQMGSGSLRRTNLALALGGYLLVLYATFLTRSGVLADVSVHSFPKGSLYRVLLAVLLGAVGVAAWAFLARRGPRGRAVAVEAAWPFVMGGAIVLLAASALLVLLGTSWPIVSSLAGETRTVGPPFYNRTSLPLWVGLLALLGAGPFLGWAGAPWRALARRMAPALAVAAAGTAVAALLGARGAAGLALFFVALLALAANLARLSRLARGRLLATGAPLAHVGLALVVAGIVGSSLWGRTERLELPLGRPVDALGATFVYGGHVEGSSPQDRWRVGVRRSGRPEVAAEVAMFRHGGGDGKEQLFRRPAILRGIGADLYVAPLGIEGATGERRVELHRGEPLALDAATLTFLRFETASMSEAEMEVRAVVDVRAEAGTETVALPLRAAGGSLEGRPVALRTIPGLSLTLEAMAVERGLVRVLAETTGAATAGTLVAELSTKPLVNVLWLGTVVMLVGCGVAVARRARDARRQESATPVAAVPPHPLLRHPKQGRKKAARPEGRRAAGAGR